MSISEKANDLLNKFGRAQYDYVVWSTQDNLVARDKARQEISDYIEELEAENERLSQLLHDEMSQLEIATDLGNKRWAALNKIYEDGEKHNTNWCKRIAQEGLGIKNA